MTQPRWLEPLPEAELMRATDRWAIETKGVPARQLMERAGEGLARAVGKHAPAGRIAVVCGKGNNGGDGLVAARLLRQAGRDVDVLAVWPPEWMGEDAQAQVKVLPGPLHQLTRRDALRLDRPLVGRPHQRRVRQRLEPARVRHAPTIATAPAMARVCVSEISREAPSSDARAAACPTASPISPWA